jgi:uncharacterized coiled-coil protein SlyX
MNAVEVSRLRARIDTLESNMTHALTSIERIDAVLVKMTADHEAMMTAKADAMRAGNIAEIRATVDSFKVEMRQYLKGIMKDP